MDLPTAAPGEQEDEKDSLIIHRNEWKDMEIGEGLLRVRLEAAALVMGKVPPTTREENKLEQTPSSHIMSNDTRVDERASTPRMEEDAFGHRNLSSPVFSGRRGGEIDWNDEGAQDMRRSFATLTSELEEIAEEHARSLVLRQLNLIDELDVLMRLLWVNPTSTTGNEPEDPTMETKSLLDADSATRYAAAVLSLFPLDSLGPQLCDYLSRVPSFRKLAPDAARRCGVRALVLPRAIPLGEAGYQLPFRQVTDSRNNFSTRDQLDLYQGRERMRDLLLTALNRALASSRGLEERGTSTPHQMVRSAAEACMGELRTMPANTAWFARTFLDHFLRVVIDDDRELDQDVKRLGDEDRINKLSKRMLSGGVPLPLTNREAIPAASHPTITDRAGLGWGAAATKTFGMPPPESILSEASLLADLFPYFAERFFLGFVQACDSHALCSYLGTMIVAELHRISDPVLDTEIAPTAVTWAAKMAGARTLARLWGFLEVYPRLASSQAAGAQRSVSGAFRALFDGLVEDEDRNPKSALHDVKETLAHAQTRGTCVVVVPWVCAFVRVAMRDAVLLETRTMSSLMEELNQVRANSEAMNLVHGYGAVRAVAEIDALLLEAAGRGLEVATAVTPLQPPSSSSSNAAFLLRMRNQPDGLAHLFDACDLDRPATSCAPLHKLRATLLGGLAPTSGSTHPPPRKVPSLRISSVQPLPALAPPYANDVASTDSVRSRLEALFLRHDESLSRAIDFAVEMVPPAACDRVLPKCIAEARAEVGRGDSGSRPPTLERVRHKAMTASLVAVRHEMALAIASILRASCPVRSNQVMDAAVDVALRRAEGRVERLMETKIADMLSPSFVLALSSPSLVTDATSVTSGNGAETVVHVARRKEGQEGQGTHTTQRVGCSAGVQRRVESSLAATEEVLAMEGFPAAVERVRVAFANVDGAARVRGLPRTPLGCIARAVQSGLLGEQHALDDIRTSAPDAVMTARALQLLGQPQLAQRLLFDAGNAVLKFHDFEAWGEIQREWAFQGFPAA